MFKLIMLLVIGVIVIPIMLVLISGLVPFPCIKKREKAVLARAVLGLVIVGVVVLTFDSYIILATMFLMGIVWSIQPLRPRYRMRQK